MPNMPESFVHVLLFGCSRCGAPVPSAVVSGSRNVEEVDAGLVELTCQCGWSGNALGAEAKGHWVHSWPSDVLDAAQREPMRYDDDSVSK